MNELREHLADLGAPRPLGVDVDVDTIGTVASNLLVGIGDAGMA